MSVCFYVSMPVCLYVGMPVCLYVGMPVCRYACLPVCRYACMPVFLDIGVSHVSGVRYVKTSCEMKQSSRLDMLYTDTNDGNDE